MDDDTEVTLELFLNLCIHLESFRQYTYSIILLCSEFYDIGQLVLLDYVQIIKESLDKVSSDIFNKMCKFHIDDNIEICEKYEEITRIALEKPETTEELIEQGKFMLQVKSEILQDLQARTQDMLYNLTKLINLGTLTPEHMELNTTTVSYY